MKEKTFTCIYPDGEILSNFCRTAGEAIILCGMNRIKRGKNYLIQRVFYKDENNNEVSIIFPLKVMRIVS